MPEEKKRTLVRLAVRFSIGVLAVIGALTVAYMLWTGTVHRILYGPNVFLTAKSPDGEYVAYAVDHPALDPPEHQVFVETRDKKQFLPVTRSFGGLDRVQQLIWSKYGEILLVRTKRHLVAVRVPEFHTLDIYTGTMWTRKQPKRGWSFAMGAQVHKIAKVDIADSGTLQVWLENRDDPVTYPLPLLSGSFESSEGDGPLPTERLLELD